MAAEGCVFREVMSKFLTIAVNKKGTDEMT